MAHRTVRSMQGFVRRFRAAVALALWAGAAMAAPPERVVSINLCTDQLAMLLADPGQLVSVSHLASDPLSSSMVVEAAKYPENRGGAEQVFLLHPDLVLAGEYTPVETISLLQRLGAQVVQVPVADATVGAADVMRMVGAAMGHPERGNAMADAFLADLAALAVPGEKATAAMYFPQGYTTGDGTLSNEVLDLTGFRNVAVEAGLTGGGILPLERLVMADPAMIVTSTPYPGASRAEEILVHPALAAVRAKAGEARTTDADWVCGTPALLNAVMAMADARRGLQ